VSTPKQQDFSTASLGIGEMLWILPSKKHLVKSVAVSDVSQSLRICVRKEHTIVAMVQLPEGKSKLCLVNYVQAEK
jgi:hypothetical protein